MTAASGIEIALWDLVRAHARDAGLQSAGRPVSRPRALLSHAAGGATNVEDPAAWRAQVHEARAEKFGWTAFKFQGDGVPSSADPEFKEPGHDPYARNLTAKDYPPHREGHGYRARRSSGRTSTSRLSATGATTCSDVIRLAKALEHVKPMWLEDPVPPDNIEAMARVTHAIDVPICTGENLYGRQGSAS